MPASSPLFTLVPAARRTPLLASIAAAVIGSAVIALSARAQIPFWPVPMTLQTLAVLAIAGLVGMRAAGLMLVFYLVEGATGLPVLSGTPQRGIGLAYMLGPTGGYLVGFLLAALAVGWAVDHGARARPLLLFAAMLGATCVIFATGLAWLARFVGWDAAVMSGLVPFIPGDLVKMALAWAIVVAVTAPVRKSI